MNHPCLYRWAGAALVGLWCVLAQAQAPWPSKNIRIASVKAIEKATTAQQIADHRADFGEVSFEHRVGIQGLRRLRILDCGLRINRGNSNFSVH